MANARFTDVIDFPAPTLADVTVPEPVTDNVSPPTILVKVEKSDPLIVVVPS